MTTEDEEPTAPEPVPQEGNETVGVVPPTEDPPTEGDPPPPPPPPDPEPEPPAPPVPGPDPENPWG